MKGFVAEPDDAVGIERGGNGHAGERRSPPPRASASWLLRIGAFVVLAAAAAWAYYANVYSAKPAMDMNMRVSAGDAAFPIVAAAVERAPVRGVVTYTGAVAAFNEEDIFPRVTGRIVEMLVYPGDAVRAGQVVARLDDVELTSRVREAEAMAVTAQANRAQMEADVTASGYGVVQMERSRPWWRRSWRTPAACAAARSGWWPPARSRGRSTRTIGRWPRRSRPSARPPRAKLEQARAMEISARRKLDAAESMVTQGRAAEADGADRARLRQYRGADRRLRGQAPRGPGRPGAAGQAILKIAQVDRVRLQANVGEKDIALIRVGSPVTVTTTAGPGLTARVTSVFPFVDQGSRTAVVEAIVDNRDRRLLPGQYVTMAFVTGERAEAITVPRGAVARPAGRPRSGW